MVYPEIVKWPFVSSNDQSSLGQEAIHAQLAFMASVVPDPRRIKSFESARAFEAWLKRRFSGEPVEIRGSRSSFI